MYVSEKEFSQIVSLLDEMRREDMKRKPRRYRVTNLVGRAQLILMKIKKRNTNTLELI